jgi:dienelactone hydrolase
MRRREFLRASAAIAMGGVMVRAQAPRDVAWLARVQTPPSTMPPDAPTLRPLLADAAGRPIRTLAAWQARREELRRWWLDFLGPMPAPRTGPPTWRTLDEDRVEGIARARISYEVEAGISTEAYLLRPEPRGPARSRPAAVVLHSTVNHSILQPAGLGPDREKAFGLALARQGFVTISPRNFLWPTNDRIDSKGETAKFLARHPRSKGMARMLHDALVAVDLISALPEVDPARIGSVGHSLGAKEVLYLAAFDDRVRATVSSEGGIGLRFSNWNAPWYLGPEIDGPSFTRDQHEILALAAPRPFLLVGGDSADGDRSWPFIEAALPVFRLYGSTPRLGLLNHKGGHAVPPEAERAIGEWMAAYT